VTPTLDDSELLRRLVAFDSTSRNSNLPIADFICDYLDRPWIRVRRHPSPDGDRTNLFIAAGPEEASGSGLGLSGHMDVVPADEQGWRTDPFTLTQVGNTYTGRGTADMKGFLAVAINQLASLDGKRLHRPLALVLTYDEELGTLGAKHFVETWPEREVLPRALVIGEPSSLRVVRMHKGYLKMRVEFEGTAAHSGYPHLGRNAIEPAARGIVALSERGPDIGRCGDQRDSRLLPDRTGDTIASGDVQRRNDQTCSAGPRKSSGRDAILADDLGGQSSDDI
jgi:acetylornithine deacetylase